jgi:hypothetical protein
MLLNVDRRHSVRALLELHHSTEKCCTTNPLRLQQQHCSAPLNPTAMTELKRNQRFSPLREPLRELTGLRRLVSKTCGPFGFLNPTRAHFHHVHTDEENGQEGIGSSSNANEPEFELPPHEKAADKVEYVWTSRNNRKGRHLLQVTLARDPATARYLVPDPTNTLRAILRNIGRMFTKYPVWDVSWLVAYIFTWGSIVWVINALYVSILQICYT